MWRKKEFWVLDFHHINPNEKENDIAAPKCFDHPTQCQEYLYTFIDGEWKIGENFENLNNYI